MIPHHCSDKRRDIFPPKKQPKKKKYPAATCVRLSSHSFTKSLLLPVLSPSFSVFLMLCCPHPESGHFILLVEETQREGKLTVHSTDAETQESPVCCRATRCLQGAQTLHRADHHYNINETFFFFFLEIKHLGETTEAIQTAPFDVHSHIVAYQKNHKPLLLLTSLHRRLQFPHYCSHK